ncbi:MAG TPA: hypothetical protein VFN67_14150 [Polyangiales bacterium]|nr:hypothetical protein [Polyangiales bacterium]
MTTYGSADLPTKIAPVVLSAYLATRRDFDVFDVQYNDSFTHIFGVKRDAQALSCALTLRLLLVRGRWKNDDQRVETRRAGHRSAAGLPASRACRAVAPAGGPAAVTASCI